MLTEFDHEVIKYANSRGEESEAVYKRLEDGQYRDQQTEAQLIAKLDRLKDKETTRYELPYGIVVHVNGKSASIVSELKEGSYGTVAALKDGILIEEWDAAIDAIESLIMAHAAAGVDIGSDAYIEGVETTVEALMNNLEDD